MKTKPTQLPIIAIIALFMTLVACNQPHTTEEVEIKQDQAKSGMNKPDDLKAIKAEIEEANSKLASLLAAGDSVGLANMYTADGKLMFAGGPSDVGRADIQTAFSHIINSGVSKANLETIAVFGVGDMVAEEGKVTLYVKDDVVAVEKYIVLWKKEAGEWKLFRDIANSNLPAE